MTERRFNGSGRLTQRQEDFCLEYLRNGGNASDAYRAAYSTERMSPKTVHEKASRLLSLDKVRARIDESRKNVARRVEIGEVAILQSAAWAMQCDPRRILRDDGTLVPPQEWPDEIALAIDGIDIKEEYEEGTRKPATGRISKLKFSSRTAARDQLMKYRGLYQKDNEQRAAGVLQTLDDLPDDILDALEDKLNAILEAHAQVEDPGSG